MTRRGMAPSDERLRRMLSVLPWLTERGTATVAETAARFGLSEAQLVKDLELAAMCGLPPYIEDLIDLRIEDGVIIMGVERFFTRQMRLTVPEGFALLAAGRALLDVSADAGALARGLAKLEARVGAPPEVDLEPPEVLADLRLAVEGHEQVEITYWSAWRDETTVRRVDPWAVFSAAGRWYLVGHCHLAGAERRFRVDRIDELRRTGTRFAPVAYVPDVDDVLGAGTDAPLVTLELPASARWVAETYPVESVTEAAGGGQIVVLRVLSLAWLEILLMRVGPGARVAEPPDLVDAGRHAAARLLSLYEPGA